MRRRIWIRCNDLLGSAFPVKVGLSTLGGSRHIDVLPGGTRLSPNNNGLKSATTEEDERGLTRGLTCCVTMTLPS